LVVCTIARHFILLGEPEFLQLIWTYELFQLQLYTKVKIKCYFTRKFLVYKLLDKIAVVKTGSLFLPVTVSQKLDICKQFWGHALSLEY
jgi:hypothetical protein